MSTTEAKFLMIVDTSEAFLTWAEKMQMLIDLMQEDPVGYIDAARKYAN